jgi:hypothetical protein
MTSANPSLGSLVMRLSIESLLRSLIARSSASASSSGTPVDIQYGSGVAGSMAPGVVIAVRTAASAAAASAARTQIVELLRPAPSCPDTWTISPSGRAASTSSDTGPRNTTRQLRFMRANLGAIERVACCLPNVPRIACWRVADEQALAPRHPAGRSAGVGEGWTCSGGMLRALLATPSNAVICWDMLRPARP